MERLKKSRTAIRTAFTRNLDLLNAELSRKSKHARITGTSCNDKYGDHIFEEEIKDTHTHTHTRARARARARARVCV